MGEGVGLFFGSGKVFFASLVAPTVLLILCTDFLDGVCESDFADSLPSTFSLSSGVVSKLMNNRLVSSVLTISYMAITFYSGFLVIRSGTGNAVGSLEVSPMGPSMLSLNCCVTAFMSALVVYLATATVYLICVTSVN